MSYVETMKAACQSAASEAQSWFSSAEAAVESMVSASQGVTWLNYANQSYNVTTTLPALPSLDTDLGIDPSALANELSKLSPELPGAYRAILSEHFPVEDFTTLEAQFTKFLSPEFLDAQRAMMVGRLERELATKRRQLVDSFAARGFSTAPGALLGAISELEATDHDKSVELSQQLYTQNLDKWFEYSKFLVSSYLEAKKAEVEAFARLTETYLKSFIELRLRGVELVAQVASTIADLRMKAFAAEAERAKLSVQLEQIKLGAWEASSRERIAVGETNVQSGNASTQIRTHALNAAAQQYANMVVALMGKDMTVMTAQGIGND